MFDEINDSPPDCFRRRRLPFVLSLPLHRISAYLAHVAVPPPRKAIHQHSITLSCIASGMHPCLDKVIKHLSDPFHPLLFAWGSIYDQWSDVQLAFLHLGSLAPLPGLWYSQIVHRVVCCFVAVISRRCEFVHVRHSRAWLPKIMSCEIRNSHKSRVVGCECTEADCSSVEEHPAGSGCTCRRMQD